MIRQNDPYTSYCIDCNADLPNDIGVFYIILNSPDSLHERVCFSCGCKRDAGHPELIERYKRIEQLYLKSK